jgi:hypothetical protein
VGSKITNIRKISKNVNIGHLPQIISVNNLKHIEIK